MEDLPWDGLCEGFLCLLPSGFDAFGGRSLQKFGNRSGCRFFGESSQLVGQTHLSYTGSFGSVVECYMALRRPLTMSTAGWTYSLQVKSEAE